MRSTSSARFTASTTSPHSLLLTAAVRTAATTAATTSTQASAASPAPPTRPSAPKTRGGAQHQQRAVHRLLVLAPLVVAHGGRAHGRHDGHNHEHPSVGRLARPADAPQRAKGAGGSTAPASRGPPPSRPRPTRCCSRLPCARPPRRPQPRVPKRRPPRPPRRRAQTRQGRGVEHRTSSARSTAFSSSAQSLLLTAAVCTAATAAAATSTQASAASPAPATRPNASKARGGALLHQRALHLHRNPDVLVGHRHCGAHDGQTASSRVDNRPTASAADMAATPPGQDRWRSTETGRPLDGNKVWAPRLKHDTSKKITRSHSICYNSV